MSYPIRKYAALVIALACFASCQDESLLGGDAAGNVKILARMSGSTPTRTCVDGVTTDGSVGILWSPGDRIGVYGSAGTANALFVSSNTSAAPEAVFAGNLKQGESPSYAYYPYDEGNS